MQFPAMIPLGPFLLHPHPLFETLGYFLGYRLYAGLRKGQGDVVTDWRRLQVMVAAIGGGALGSKLLAWLENPAVTYQHLAEL